MAMNGSNLETEITTAINSAVGAEDSWAAQLATDISNQLRTQIGEEKWMAGDMDNAVQILTTALGDAIIPHLEAIVAAVAAEAVNHITGNAEVSTSVTTEVATTGTAASQAGTGTGTGTGTVA